jgi:hypothetical protein
MRRQGFFTLGDQTDLRASNVLRESGWIGDRHPAADSVDSATLAEVRRAARNNLKRIFSSSKSARMHCETDRDRPVDR